MKQSTWEHYFSVNLSNLRLRIYSDKILKYAIRLIGYETLVEHNHYTIDDIDYVYKVKNMEDIFYYWEVSKCLYISKEHTVKDCVWVLSPYRPKYKTFNMVIAYDK